MRAVLFLNDLFEFDISTLDWRDITENVQGKPPEPRFYHRLGSANGVLYIFGGLNVAGAIKL